MENIEKIIEEDKKIKNDKFLRQHFSKEELELVKVYNSAILWGEKFLKNPENPNKPLILRWYQKEILSSKKRKKVIRASRRIGKSITLITEILWKLFTRQYRRIILITPYKSQIDELWDVMEKMVENTYEITSSIKRKTTNPYELELYNGSRLKCFTAGSKSSSKGSNIRSISADDIYLDEADYLGEPALAAINALFMTSKETSLWASSTPTGRRESFYKWVTQADQLGFDAFHYKAEVSPNWVSIKEAQEKNIPMSECTEYFYRSTYSESNYCHEWEAEWGDEEEGVFKAIHLDKNIYDFGETVEQATLQLYNPGFKQNEKNIYVMGIDWNSQSVGTQIVITEYLREATDLTYYETDDDGNKTAITSTFKDKYRLFYRETIAGHESTQLFSVAKIIDILRIYKIDHIYCDQGYGQTNIESLREKGKELGLRLEEKLVPIDFGRQIEVIDPLTKQLNKQPIKPFIVYTAVHEIELCNCLLPEVEDDKSKLIHQMRSFTVKRYSQTGVPVFSQGEEHTLIAWLLSIVGFHLEYSNLIKHEFDPSELINGRITKPNKFMPFINESTKMTLDNSKKIGTDYRFDTIKPMIPGNKVTLDPGYYNDTEKPESYIHNIDGRSPWSSSSVKINNFNMNRRILSKGSPTGRKTG